MKRVIIPILAATIMVSLTGCSIGSSERDKDTKAQSANTEKKADDKTAQKNISEIDKNTGVVVETVADVFKEPNIMTERVTQAIFNQSVVLVDSKENWTKVKTQDGCSRWVKSKFIELDSSSITPTGYEYRLVITSKSKGIYSQAKAGAVIKEVVMGTEFYIINKTEGWYQVALPGNASGWVSENGTIRVAVNEHIPETSPSDLVSTASKLKGTVYMQGGISNIGIDSSGLTYVCSRINGFDIPRDIEKQFALGKNIEKKVEAIKPGDFLFFSTYEDLKDVSLVGIYVGNSQFIHASKSRGSVIIGNLNDNIYKNRLVGIKRLFKD